MLPTLPTGSLVTEGLVSDDEFAPTATRQPPDGHEVPLSYFDTIGCISHGKSESLISKISSSSCEDSGVFLEENESKCLSKKFLSDEEKHCYTTDSAFKMRHFSSRSPGSVESDGERSDTGITSASTDSADELDSISSFYSHNTKNMPVSSKDNSRRAPISSEMETILNKEIPWSSKSVCNDFLKNIENSNVPRNYKEPPTYHLHKHSYYSSHSKADKGLSFKEKIALFSRSETNDEQQSPQSSIKHAVSIDCLNQKDEKKLTYAKSNLSDHNKWYSTHNVNSSEKVPKIYSNTLNYRATTESSPFSIENISNSTLKYSPESLYPQSQLLNYKRYSLGHISSPISKYSEESLKKNMGGSLLSSVNDSKSSGLSKLKGLVIPGKTTCNPSLNTTTKSTNSESSLKSNFHIKNIPISSTSKDNMDGTIYKMHSLLSEPPWKGVNNSLPKYSPAFKRRTLELPKVSTLNSPTPPSSMSPLTPSSPSSVCSSNASSTTKQNIFQFSLTHSKPVVPILPEKPNMSPPSIPSESSEEQDEPLVISTPRKRDVPPIPPPMLPTKKPPPPPPLNKPVVEKTKSLETNGYHETLSRSTSNPSVFRDGIQNPDPTESSSTNNFDEMRSDYSQSEMIQTVAEIIALSRQGPSKNEHSFSPPVCPSANPLDRLDTLLCSRMIENEKNNGAESEPDKEDSCRISNDEIDANSENVPICKNDALEKDSYWLEIHRHKLNLQESDDDNFSTFSQKTDDSRYTPDDLYSDTTSNSHELDFKPKVLSQQKTVLRNYQEEADSAKDFKALAGKWEQRSGDTPDSLSPIPSILSSPKKENGIHSSNNSNPSLMPRVLEDHRSDVLFKSSSSAVKTREPYVSRPLSSLQEKKDVDLHRTKKNDFIDTSKHFRQSLENLGPQRAKSLISSSKSVSDICKVFETQNSSKQNFKCEQPLLTKPQSSLSSSSLIRTSIEESRPSRDFLASKPHRRMSSIDSTNSESSSSIPTHYGSMGSLTSTSSLISTQELQQLIEDANLSLEESGTSQQEISVVVLHREFSTGTVGITLAGGADYETKEITIHRVINGSLAARDGRIQREDRVISINGQNLKGITHRQAVELLKSPRSELVLVLSRSIIRKSEVEINRIQSISPMDISKAKNVSSTECQNNMSKVELYKDGAGIGFIIGGGKNSPLGDKPITIRRIFSCGPAYKCGGLDEGDEIVAINSLTVTSSMTRTEVWHILKQLPDGIVQLTIRKNIPGLSSSSSSSS